MAGDVNSSTKRRTASPINSSPATFSGRLPKPMKARMIDDSAQDAGDPVGILELEQQAVEADREQDERDIRVGQQVQERLQWVHRQVGSGRVREVERQRRAVDG